MATLISITSTTCEPINPFALNTTLHKSVISNNADMLQLPRKIFIKSWSQTSQFLLYFPETNLLSVDFQRHGNRKLQPITRHALLASFAKPQNKICCGTKQQTKGALL